MKIIFLSSLLLGITAISGFPQTPPVWVHLLERVVETGETSQPKITLLLRLPAGHTAEIPTAKGILTFCTWEQEDTSLRARLQNDNDPLVAYAKKNQLAILTWNTATLWKTGKSFDQISRSERRAQDEAFDAVARAWERGVGQLCKEQNLPQAGFLLYGISRGAHWSCRLALRAPERFLAVHLHVANSYDKAQGSAKGPLWLVSSGDLDMGRDNALAFYWLCQSKGFPILFKVANGLGHATSPEIERVRDGFFDYALQVKDRAGSLHPSALMHQDLARVALTGDLLTQEVYRGDAAKIVPAAQQVPLPDEKLAKVWGFLRK